jgi:hypothetical protein
LHYKIVDRFYGQAKALRKVFDRRFADPLKAEPERFVWDYWHVPKEFSHLRTPAFHYFPRSVYEPFHRYLVKWGRENLGCHDISPPWLSCYIDGCFQATHRDTPHGPLAFVYSLGLGGHRGGETFIVRPCTLIPPKFNRLTLFNPDLPHGVRTVRGSRDPREGRLVIHGWFVQPRPFWTGPLQVRDVSAALSELTGAHTGQLGHGFLSLRLGIAPSGKVRRLQILMDTRQAAGRIDSARFFDRVHGLKFPSKKSASQLTLPLILAP